MIVLFILLPGTLLAGDFATIGAPICGYGKYRLNGECYEYGVQNNTLCDGVSVTGAACLGAFVESSGEFANLTPFSGGFADIGAPTDNESPADTVCGGGGVTGAACLGAFVESSGEFANLSPFSGGFTDIGAPSGTFTTMLENDCLSDVGTPMAGYYVTTLDSFSPVTNAVCPTGKTNYVIPNDCQYIDMTSDDPNNIHSPTHPENWLCGVLCDKDMVYIGTSYASNEICTTKKININWNPDNGNDTFQSMCEYNQEIVMPTDPVRPGYTFTGWKLVEEDK